MDRENAQRKADENENENEKKMAHGCIPASPGCTDWTKDPRLDGIGVGNGGFDLVSCDVCKAGCWLSVRWGRPEVESKRALQSVTSVW